MTRTSTSSSPAPTSWSRISVPAASTSTACAPPSAPGGRVVVAVRVARAVRGASVDRVHRAGRRRLRALPRPARPRAGAGRWSGQRVPRRLLRRAAGDRGGVARPPDRASANTSTCRSSRAWRSPRRPSPISRNHMHGRPELTTPIRNPETPSIERALDGYVGFNTNTGQMFQSFLLLIERPDLLDDAELATFGGRMARRPEWQQVIDAFMSRHTVRRDRDPRGRAPHPRGTRVQRRDDRRGRSPRRPWGLRPEPGRVHAAAVALPDRRRRRFDRSNRLPPRGEHTDTVEARPLRRCRPSPAPTHPRCRSPGSRCSISRHGGRGHRRRSSSRRWGPRSSTSSRRRIPTACA